MMNFEDLRALMVATAKADRKAPTAYSFNGQNYSYDALNDTLRAEMNELAGDFDSYRENALTVYKLMQQTIDEVFPKSVIARYGDFAEIKVGAQGQKPVFTQKTGRTRAKKNFVTKVGLAGIYEVFKLDSTVIEVSMTATGGAAQIGLEEFLDGRVDFADLLEILMEGMDDDVYVEVAEALKAMVANFGPYNKYSTNTFDETKMDQLIATVSAYGVPTIYCTFEFAATMIPSTGWVSDDMRNERWNKGFIGNYKGTRVVVLPQSVTEDNSEKIIDPSWAYIFPGDAKPVKIAFEGQTVVDEFKNYDRSREIQAYKKFGVATITSPNLAAYQNTSLVISNKLN